MKTKGISFWEQNIERFVIGLALIVCVAIVAMQFIGEPNAVQIGSTMVSPGAVDQQLIDRAKEVERELDSTSSHSFGDAAKPVFGRFDERLNAPVVPAPSMVVTAPRLGIGSGIVVDVDRPYVEAVVPTPTEIHVAQHFDTIAPEVVESTPGLSMVIGSAPPFDLTWNTVSGRFDIASLLQQYANGGANGEAALLLAWYNNRIDFIDLKLFRQELVNGQWSEERMIDPMPGGFSFRSELKDRKIDDAVRNWVLETSASPATRASIIQPAFYLTLTESWVRPGAVAVAGAGGAQQQAAADDPAAELRIERERLLKQIAAIDARLKAAGCPPEAPPETTTQPEKPPPPSRSGGGGAASPGSGIGESSGGQGLRDPSGGAANAACKSDWARKKRLRTQLDRLDAEIERLTGQVQVKPVEVVDAVVEPETVIDIWAHDLEIEPGKTYRYRMAIEVYNPLFGRKLSLIPAQQPLAEKFSNASEPSEWSEASTAQPPLLMYVTRAMPSSPNTMGMAHGQATAEVYRFHNGRWWLDTFPVTPGDRIGGVKTPRGGSPVDYSTDWFVLDIAPSLGGEDERSGLAATVLLQRMSDPAQVEWRVPGDEANNEQRRALNRRVRLADLGGEGLAMLP